MVIELNKNPISDHTERYREAGLSMEFLGEMAKAVSAMKAAGYDEVTMMHGWILKYLYDHRDQEVYQRDIEKQFSIGRSTVTTIIQLMEKRDLVCRQSVEHDARLKRVMLTEKGFKHHDLVEENIYAIHQNVMSGISDEEKKVFLDIVQRMDRNLSDIRHKGGTVC